MGLMESRYEDLQTAIEEFSTSLDAAPVLQTKIEDYLHSMPNAQEKSENINRIRVEIDLLLNTDASFNTTRSAQAFRNFKKGELVKLSHWLNNQLQTTSKSKVRSEQKIQWNGTQKDLAELFDQLEKKGWITVKERDVKRTCDTICAAFNLENSKNNQESDEAQSFYQIMKRSARDEKIYDNGYREEKFTSIVAFLK